MRAFFALRRPLLRPLAWLTLLLPAMAGAQPPQAADPAPAATSAASPTPLAHISMRVQQPLPDADAPVADWRAAHEAVAAFPRGHADIVLWETAQGTAPAPHHQGHKP